MRCGNDEAARGGDFRSAARSLTFFENLVKPTPEYQQSLAQLGSSGEAIGTPIREFLELKLPAVAAAAADTDLTFELQPVPEPETQPDLLLAVELPGEQGTQVLSLAGGAMLAAALLEPGWPVLALLCLAGFGIGAAHGVFWAIPGAVRLGGASVPAGAIALISMFGTAGGIVGPWLTGVLVAGSGGYPLAIALLASLLAAALPVLALNPGARGKAVRP